MWLMPASWPQARYAVDDELVKMHQKNLSSAACDLVMSFVVPGLLQALSINLATTPRHMWSPQVAVPRQTSYVFRRYKPWMLCS
jgi:hypothetical protein